MTEEVRVQMNEGQETSTTEAIAVPPKKAKQSLYSLIVEAQATKEDVRKRLIEDLGELTAKHVGVAPYYILYLYDSDSISNWAADKIQTALLRTAPKDTDVLLVLHNHGGSIEPAYQISKLCKHYSRSKFITVIPRRAKSAATLISLGADEIHMGLMSELGPIDPQMNGRPVLGLRHSLEIIAEVCEKSKGSSEMFATYLQKSLYVPDIGYYDRIGESAIQYAVRLLTKKKTLKKEKATKIANHLVNEYKDHGFVIDLEEAQEILGTDLIKPDTKELQFGQEVHTYLKEADFWLNTRSLYITCIGNVSDLFVFERK